KRLCGHGRSNHAFSVHLEGDVGGKLRGLAHSMSKRASPAEGSDGEALLDSRRALSPLSRPHFPRARKLALSQSLPHSPDLAGSSRRVHLSKAGVWGKSAGMVFPKRPALQE